MWGALHSFSIKNIFYDKIDFFYFAETLFTQTLVIMGFW